MLQSRTRSFIENGRLMASKASYTGSEPANVHEVIADLINAIGGHAAPAQRGGAEVSHTGDTVHFSSSPACRSSAAQEQLQAFSKQLFTHRTTRRRNQRHVLRSAEQFWQQARPGAAARIASRSGRVNPDVGYADRGHATLQRNCSKQRAAELFAR